MHFHALLDILILEKRFMDVEVDDLQKVVCNGDSYKELRPLLHDWIEAMKAYCSIHDYYDNPWWHNERASISVLAGAAWKGDKRLGPWIALEEFSVSKRVVNRQEYEGGVEPEKKDRTGRCDLYISNKRTSFAFEAKQAWQSIGIRSFEGWFNANKGLVAAWGDAGHLFAFEADKRYAATFIVPYIPISELPVDLAEQRSYVRDQVVAWLKNKAKFERKKGKPTAYAYYFPYNCEMYSNYYIGRFFPGVLLVLEHRQRGG